jgi:hypothetical protein
MTKDALEEVARAVPEDWRRRTIIAFTAADGDDDAATAVLTREIVPEGETLANMAARQLLDLGGLPRMRVLEHGAFELNGAPAMRLAYAWIGPRGGVEQSTVWVESPGDHGTVVMSLTTTCAEQQAAAMRPIFARILERLHRGPRVPAISNVVPAPVDEPLLDLPMPGSRVRPVNAPSSAPAPAMPFIPMPGIHARR